jgi:hypothetical protein
VCEELLIAIQDVFPELKQQMQNKTPTSDLGKLLRWQFLENRKARRLPPPPPLALLSTPPQDGSGGGASKKKKRRKRKKKQDGVSASGEQGGESAAIDEQELIDTSMDRPDDTVTGGNPSLDSLPSEFSNIPNDKNPLNSSTFFFEQIQPQDQIESILSPTQFIKQIQPQTELIPKLPSMPGLDDDDRSSQTPNLNRPDKISPAEDMVTPSHSQITPDEGVIKSPTHEWVPEESAESRLETPPSDAIKDPLTLPFLLTLSDKHGMTTTTIDGSLVAAVRASDEEKKLETHRVLFEEWLEQLDHDQKEDRKNDYRSFIEFLQARLHGGNQPLGIPFQTLQDACMNIACYSCRQEATSEVEKLRLEEKSIILNEYCLQEESRAQTNATVDSAFDYVSLEEGHHTLTPRVQEKEPDPKTSICFAVSDHSKSKGNALFGRSHLYLQAVTQKHLDVLSEQWLPCGIEEDVMVTTVVQGDSSKFSKHEAAIILSENELRLIQHKVLEKERNAKNSLEQIVEDRSSMIAEIEKAENKANQNIEFTMFPILKDCNSYGMDLFEGLLTLLRKATNDHHHVLPDLQMHIWTSYLGALDKAIKSCETFYNTIELMADQRGNLPKMFISKEFRAAFKTVVQEKTKTWNDLYAIFSKNLKSHVLKEYYTREVWQQSRNTFEDKLLDEDCHELVKVLSRWSEVVFGGKMQEIMKERIGQTNDALGLLQKIIEPLAEEYATVERYFSTDRNVYFANLRSQVVLVFGVKKTMRLLDNTEVLSMAMGVILMWRHTRIMQSRMIKSKDTPTLPLQLKRWMLQDERDFEHWRNVSVSSTTVTHHHMNCRPGIGGKRRAMCVLAGLVYRWLGDRCMEWKAEMAEKELLIDFMSESSAGTSLNTNGENSNGQNKTGKKKKKKKKTKAAAVPQSISENGIAATSGNNSNLNIKGTQKEQKKTKVQTRTQPKQNETETQGIDIPKNETKLNGIKENIVEEAPQVQNGAVSAGENSTPSVPYDNVDDFPTYVYVRDDKDIISGRDFLIGRLRELLQNADGNVVFVQQ